MSSTRVRVLIAAEGKESKEIFVDSTSTAAPSRFGVNPSPRRALPATGRMHPPRAGRRPKARQEHFRRIIETTARRKPAKATHRSTRTVDETLGTNHSQVNRVGHGDGLKLSICHSFEVTDAPLYVTEGFLDAVDL